MKGTRFLVLTISAIVLAIPSTQAMSEETDEKNTNADGSPVVREQVIQKTVDWTITPAQCSVAPSEIKGSGHSRKTVTLLRNPRGAFNYKINEEVSGTATDKNNHHYIFVYVNNAFVESAFGFPLPQPPYSVYGTDEFRLIPVDGGVAYTTNIFFNLRINADGSLTNLGSVFSPNASCDPI